MNRAILVVTLGAFVCNLPGCTTTHKRPMAELPPSPWRRIAGFTTLDGGHHSCDCDARVEGETMRIRARERSPDPEAATSQDNVPPRAEETPSREDDIPIQDIATVDVVEESGVLTGLAIIGAFVAVVGIIVYIGLSSLSVSVPLGR